MPKNLERIFAFNETPIYELFPGTVIFCKLPFNAEHSGIYVGYLGEYDRCIVELGGDGEIRLVTPEEFLEGVNNTRISGIATYAFCDTQSESPLDSSKVARRALAKVGTYRNYNLVADNCHQFTSGCLSGNFENDNNFYWMLKDEVSRVLNQGKSVSIKRWDYKQMVKSELSSKRIEEKIEANDADRHNQKRDNIENDPNLSEKEKRERKAELQREFRRKQNEIMADLMKQRDELF